MEENKIRATRKSLGLTQIQVKEQLLGIPTRTQQDWESGKHLKDIIRGGNNG